jgi:general secretion pathway protein G
MINRLMEKKRQGEEGFTLIEMLIVVIILGILAAVVVFGVSTFRKDSAAKACTTDVKSVETAAQAYKAKNGAYPTGATDAARINVLVTGEYLKSAPSTTNGYVVTLTDGGGVAGSTPACNAVQ